VQPSLFLTYQDIFGGTLLVCQHMKHLVYEEMTQRSSDDQTKQPHSESLARDFEAGSDAGHQGRILADAFAGYASEVLLKDIRKEIQNTFTFLFRKI
jgi:hypothetical protein